MTTLTSHNNPKIKQIRLLRQRKQRQQTHLFLVEGIRHVGEALEAGAHLEYLCYAPDLLTNNFARDLVRQIEGRAIPCYAVDAQVFATLADKENPQGILAVVQQSHWTLQDVNPVNLPWGVALVSPQDPGNLGAILRTIDAVGASGLLLLDDSVDPYHPSAVRASMGALFWYPLVRASFADFNLWSCQFAYHVYGASAHASQDYRTVRHYASPRILLLGSEREGLSSEQAAVCEHLIRLPMQGRVTSLNLAVAAGILLYDMLAKA